MATDLVNPHYSDSGQLRSQRGRRLVILRYRYSIPELDGAAYDVENVIERSLGHSVENTQTARAKQAKHADDDVEAVAERAWLTQSDSKHGRPGGKSWVNERWPPYERTTMAIRQVETVGCESVVRAEEPYNDGPVNHESIRPSLTGPAISLKQRPQPFPFLPFRRVIHRGFRESSLIHPSRSHKSPPNTTDN